MEVISSQPLLEWGILVMNIYEEREMTVFQNQIKGNYTLNSFLQGDL